MCEGYLQADGTVEPATDAEGCFATGDLGRIDADGYLWLTDRKKETIVTSTGKNISPVLVENTLKEHPLIGQALVHGDSRSFLLSRRQTPVSTDPNRSRISPCRPRSGVRNRVN